MMRDYITPPSGRFVNPPFHGYDGTPYGPGIAPPLPPREPVERGYFRPPQIPHVPLTLDPAARQSLYDASRAPGFVGPAPNQNAFLHANPHARFLRERQLAEAYGRRRGLGLLAHRRRHYPAPPPERAAPGAFPLPPHDFII